MRHDTLIEGELTRSVIGAFFEVYNVVDEKVVVEIKSTERIPQSVLRQLLSYLKASRLEVGLLLHFGPSPRFYRQIFRES